MNLSSCLGIIQNGADLYSFVNLYDENQKQTGEDCYSLLSTTKLCLGIVLRLFVPEWSSLHATPPRSCLKVRTPAPQEDFCHIPGEGWIPSEGDLGTLRWVVKASGWFSGNNTKAQSSQEKLFWIMWSRYYLWQGLHPPDSQSLKLLILSLYHKIQDWEACSWLQYHTDSITFFFHTKLHLNMISFNYVFQINCSVSSASFLVTLTVPGDTSKSKRQCWTHSHAHWPAVDTGHFISWMMSNRAV